MGGFMTLKSPSSATRPPTSIAPIGTPAEKIALRMMSGHQVTHAALETWTRRAANWLRSLDLQRGDHVAFMLENRWELVALAWAAQRCGLYYTPIPTHLLAEEAAYIARDSGARLLVTSSRFETLWLGVRACRPWRA